jgi:aspartokinase/homoserine dehydrogenase 1
MFRSIKFGGTSVGSVNSMRNCLSVVKSSFFNGERVVITVSALSKVTAALVEICNLCKRGDESAKSEALRLIDYISNRHRDFVYDLFGKDDGGSFFANILEVKVKEIETLVHASWITGFISNATIASICSFGEVLSSLIFARLLETNGINVMQVSATKLIKTNGDYLSGDVLENETRESCIKVLLPILSSGIVPIVTGFIASNMQNETTLLGRGSSDYTAAILGAALDVNRIDIYTDVEGVMSADPKIVENVKSFDEIDFDVMSAMSVAGAKVVHPKALWPAVAKNIPIYILNTFNLSFKGTKIYHKVEDIEKNFTAKACAIASLNLNDSLSQVSIILNKKGLDNNVLFQVVEVLKKNDIELHNIFATNSDFVIKIIINLSDSNYVIKILHNIILLSSKMI